MVGEQEHLHVSFSRNVIIESFCGSLLTLSDVVFVISSLASQLLSFALTTACVVTRGD